jgi:hypothetical protein
MHDRCGFVDYQDGGSSRSMNTKTTQKSIDANVLFRIIADHFYADLEH